MTARTQNDLAIRQHDRHQCSVPASVTVAPEDADVVMLTRTVAGADGRVGVTISDHSLGGIGLRSSIYLPRHCRLVVRLDGTGAGSEGEAPLVIRRVMLVDRQPTYYLGTSFDMTPARARTFVDRLMAMEAGSDQSADERRSA